MSILWKSEFANIQKRNGLPKYANKSKKFITEKLLQKVPEKILHDHPENCIRIPMVQDTRSLNLSNSAAIILFEALRQHGFEGMEHTGKLREFSWQ